MTIWLNGDMALKATYLVFNVQMEGNPPLRVRIEGTSTSDFHTAGTAFWTRLSDVSVTAEAVVLGTVIPMNDAATFMDDGASGIYGCTDEGLALEPDGEINAIPRSWRRVE